MVLCSVVAILAFLLLIVICEEIVPRVRRVGGLVFFRFGRFGGSFYLTKR